MNLGNDVFLCDMLLYNLELFGGHNNVHVIKRIRNEIQEV